MGFACRMESWEAVPGNRGSLGWGTRPGKGESELEEELLLSLFQSWGEGQRSRWKPCRKAPLLLMGTSCIQEEWQLGFMKCFWALGGQ